MAEILTKFIALFHIAQAVLITCEGYLRVSLTNSSGTTIMYVDNDLEPDFRENPRS